MANRIVSVHAGIYGIGIYAIMLPSSGFSVAHCLIFNILSMLDLISKCNNQCLLDGAMIKYTL